MLTDGAAHAVDSSELAFKLAAVYAFRSAYPDAGPSVLEPIMTVEVTVPAEFQVHQEIILPSISARLRMVDGWVIG